MLLSVCLPLSDITQLLPQADVAIHTAMYSHSRVFIFLLACKLLFLSFIFFRRDYMEFILTLLKTFGRILQ